MFIQFLVFPPIVRKYGALNCLKAVTMAYPTAYILTPFAALLPTQLTQQIGLFAIMLIKCWVTIFAFPCSTILLTNSAPSLRLLGTLNGVSTSLSALGRAAGPAIGGLTFSWGVDWGYVILPWWTLAFFSILGAIPVWWLIEMDGFGAEKTSNFEEEDAEGDDDLHHALLQNDLEAHESPATPNGLQSPPELEHSGADEFAVRGDDALSTQLQTRRTKTSHRIS